MSQGMQQEVSRARPPRVQITYDVETGGKIEKKELAFVAGILADLSGPKSALDLPPVFVRKFVEIDRDNFESVMKSIAPRVIASVPNVMPDAGENATFDADITFNSIDDFHPVSVVRKIPALNSMFATRNRLRDLIPSSPLMVDQIAEIDQNITRQLNLIMHHEDFQKMESTWRGLHYLVMKSETGEKLKLKVLNISKLELIKDMQKAAEFDQSSLFKKVYEEEYGTYGGEPYSMLMGAYEFGRSQQDIELLKQLSGVAAVAHAPFVASACVTLFDLEDYADLSKPRDLAKIFESAELQAWQEFRESEDSRFVTLTLPKVLLRLPYGEKTVPVEEMHFEEDVDGSDTGKYLWGNTAFILTERITNSFTLYGWTAAIRGVEGGGLVDGLPLHVMDTPQGNGAVLCPTQVAISDKRVKELDDLGFMAICHCKGSGKAAFFGGQSTYRPKKYLSDTANESASNSAMLPYILNASRFAHYIKVIMREKVGTFLTRAGIENFLNNWIAQYVLPDESADQELKAAFPLQQGRIIVTEIPGNPGAYKLTMFLRPHFQLEELTSSVRLVVESRLDNFSV